MHAPIQLSLFDFGPTPYVSPIGQTLLTQCAKSLDQKIERIFVDTSEIMLSILAAHGQTASSFDLGVKLTLGENVKLSLDRAKVFSRQMSCVCCRTEAKLLSCEKHANNKLHDWYNVNLYGIKNKRLVLMTIDHIVPKSLGGRDNLANYQTLCYDCNRSKSNIISTQDIPIIDKNLSVLVKTPEAANLINTICGAQLVGNVSHPNRKLINVALLKIKNKNLSPKNYQQVADQIALEVDTIVLGNRVPTVEQLPLLSHLKWWKMKLMEKFH